MGKGKKRVSTEGGQSLGDNPFSSLEMSGLAPAKKMEDTPKSVAPRKASRDRGRLDVKRVKSGRGGKTVTLATGWKGISNDEKIVLAKSIQKRCGVGGSVKNGDIEIQGDKREEVKQVLEAAGFRVVLAGG